MATANLARRVAALEEELAQLKEKLANGKAAEPEIPWWEKRWGLFDNDPDYDKAMELGRKYRESLRPKPAKKRKPAVKKRTASKSARASAK